MRLSALLVLAAALSLGGCGGQILTTSDAGDGPPTGDGSTPPGDGRVGDAPAADAGGDAPGPITTNPTNILNNGGFEYGLQCFNGWVWSQTGEDFKGDHDFFLTTSAHSGGYALEIRCEGADCLKAAAFTQIIDTPPGQAYRLSLYAQCPSGGSGLVGIAGTTAGELIESLTCDDQWNLKEVSFTAGSGGLRVYVYDTSTQWLRADDLVLTYDDGTVPAQTVRHAGARDVRVSGQTVLVDGAPYLALGFYDVPRGDLQQVADVGGNTVAGFGGYTHHDCFNTEEQSYLDQAYDLGIGVVPDSTFSARLDVPEVFAAITERFARHLANVAWYLDDEPDHQGVPRFYVSPETLIAEHQAARSRTSLPVTAAFQRADWGTVADLAPYAGSVDLWLAEPYGTDFSGITRAVDNFNGAAPRPIWLAQDDVPANYVVPKAYFAVTEGVTGILYFTWEAFTADAAKLDAATQAFTELRSLKDVIFGANVDGVTGPQGVNLLARQYQGKTHILAVNPTSQTVQGAFTVPGLTAGTTVTVMFEDRTLTAGDGQFSDTFAGVARHVYRIE